MKHSILLQCDSPVITAALSQYLETFFTITRDASTPSLKSVLFDTYPGLSVIKEFHEKYPDVLIYIFASANTQIPLLPFPIKVVERPIALKDLRMQLEEPSPQTTLSLNEFKLYVHNRRLTHPNPTKSAILTEKETKILAYLHKVFPSFVDKETLLKDVWNYTEGITTHTLETHIYKLKHKLILSSGENLLKTNEEGYSLNL